MDSQHFAPTWTILLIVASCGVAAAIALLVLRLILMNVLGPIFEYETLRLARKGHTFWLRIAFAVLVLALLYTAKPTFEERPGANRNFVDVGAGEDLMSQNRHELEVFAEEFTNSLLLALAVAVTLVTPLYFGSVISDEREKRTLDFVMATHLTSREIVLGKFAARVLNLGGVMLVGLPIVASVQLWGGVDWERVLLGFGVILVSMLSFAALSTCCSTFSVRTRNAVIASYVFVFILHVPPVGYLSPIAFDFVRENLKERIAREGRLAGGSTELALIWSIFIAFHVVSTVFFLLVAVRMLRYFASRNVGRKAVVAADSRLVVVTRPLSIVPNPRLSGNPLVWKERYLGRTVGGRLLGSALWVYAFLGLGILLVLAVALRFDGTQGFLSDIGIAARLLTVVLSLIVLVSVALRLAATISRECEQRTLEGLLTLPVRRGQILAAKWWGTWRRAWLALCAVGLSFTIAAHLTNSPSLCWILFPLAFFAQLSFFGNLGLFLSVAGRSTSRAYLLLVVVFVTVGVSSWIVSYLNYDPDVVILARGPGWLDDHRISEMGDWVSPPQTWWRLTAPRSDPTRDVGLIGFVPAAVGFGIGGLVLWLLTVMMFQRREYPGAEMRGRPSESS
jgi:ABC-type transport system involved in multi-copper enzyme maturation permease subunit